MTKKVYLAGPMTGLPSFNFPTFLNVAKQLRKKGYEVFCPAEHDIKMHGTDFMKYPGFEEGDSSELCKHYSGFDIRETLSADTQWICHEADMLMMLPGWSLSKGAQAEYWLARAIGLEVQFWEGIDERTKAKR